MSNWQFWTLKTGWPADRGGNVFFGRAINEIGRLLFGDQWTGKEPAATDTGPDKFRMRLVQLAIRDGLADGALVSVLRPQAGGEFSGPQPASHWNTEKVEPRFSYCMIDPRNPFSAGIAGNGFQHIFITRESLDAFKKARQKPAPAPEPAPELIKKHVGKSKLFAAWLHSEIEASPGVRTLSKKDIAARADAEFELSKRQAVIIRDEVIRDFPDAVQCVWKGAGAPQKRKAAASA